jgi:hypothetical protein
MTALGCCSSRFVVGPPAGVTALYGRNTQFPCKFSQFPTTPVTSFDCVDEDSVDVVDDENGDDDDDDEGGKNALVAVTAAVAALPVDAVVV